ncbi:MAG: CinA family nicotinamide mononucleotide deamidase-related protein [Tannerellaceae bacterium]|jgi:nicotinamide-nucleotide amidase|nr:CinA family nicotinamide mononucleotide deamidase-related protein [Tannerellaceae bacterium]
MDVHIITIGDELLIGQVVDTNSAWMGQQLENEGFRATWRTTVGDTERDILEAVDAAMQRAGIVLLTGGLGPTKDDITRKALCRYFGCGLHFSQEVYDNITGLFHTSGRAMNHLTRDQAMVPDACTVIRNRVGTAPCTWFEREGNVLVSMPGVPHEMKWLMTHEVLPRLKKRYGQDTYIRHRTTWVSGYTESALAIALSAFEEALPPFMKLAYLPEPGLIRLRLSAYAGDERQAEKAMDEQREKLHRLLEGHILAGEEGTLEERIGEALLSRNLCMGTAESCTGGRIAAMITSVPGSSRYFTGGIVSYDNEVKHRLLGVPEETLRRYGAVSKPVVEQMASGAIRALGCDCAVATSGIAGPDGGTAEKPVGTVWIAAAWKEKVVSGCYHFSALRETNITRASGTALSMLLDLLANDCRYLEK